MTWPDVIRSVQARIHDGRAQDGELRAKWRERMPEAGRQQFRITLHCAACHYDTEVISDVSHPHFGGWYCAHCGTDNPEITGIKVHPRSPEQEPASAR